MKALSVGSSRERNVRRFSGRRDPLCSRASQLLAVVLPPSSELCFGPAKASRRRAGWRPRQASATTASTPTSDHSLMEAGRAADGQLSHSEHSNSFSALWLLPQPGVDWSKVRFDSVRPDWLRQQPQTAAPSVAVGGKFTALVGGKGEFDTIGTGLVFWCFCGYWDDKPKAYMAESGR